MNGTLEQRGAVLSVPRFRIGTETVTLDRERFTLEGVWDVQQVRPEATLWFAGRLVGIATIVALAAASLMAVAGAIDPRIDQVVAMAVLTVAAIVVTAVSNVQYFESRAEIWLHRRDGKSERLPTEGWTGAEVDALHSHLLEAIRSDRGGQGT